MSMKALTIWQPWASLILAGAKPYEFRRWAAPRWVQGQRIVIHAGARPAKKSEIAELLIRFERDGGKGTGLKVEIARPLLERWHASPASLPLASGLGTAILGEPRQASILFAGDIADSDRVDHSIWAWPLTEIEAFAPLVPMKGAQGFWDWPGGLAA